MVRKKDKPTNPPARRADKADDADSAAWQRLIASTKPLTGESRNRHVWAPTRNGGKPLAKAKPSAKTKPASAATKAAPPDAVAGGPSPSPQSALMPRTRRRLARGSLPIEARLDLHGLTLMDAERALTTFVARARAQGQVWLLVITGKGTRGEGKLRRALPEWLDRGALAGQIVEYGPSAPNHGGDGAFYLRARRARR